MQFGKYSSLFYLYYIIKANNENADTFIPSSNVNYYFRLKSQ